MTQKIYLGPLQGLTTHVYRKLHNEYFGGVDKYYSPYLRFETGKDLKKSSYKDLLPENNEGINFVPQVLGTDVDMFVTLANKMKEFGYDEVNWNLGCPYPMATKRGFGSALVSNPELVDSILSEVLSKTDIKVSIKCRLGLENNDDIFELLNVLNKHELGEVTVHTRNAKQLYKGKADADKFMPLTEIYKGKLIYNGDITKVSDIEILNEKFNNYPDTYMVGRGLLKNPFLAQEIKGQIFLSHEKKKVIKQFHAELFNHYKSTLHGSHILLNMVSHWEYLSHSFDDSKKVFKKIKKAKSLNRYNEAVNEVL
ncbi:MAG: tRNA-dihydrouridine synthase family protein [Ichthyobacteriaceae bacterium]|nr:tRNA-dihydrouridine synthase family protein [Ichthyobacteriaceae bacterium]